MDFMEIKKRITRSYNHSFKTSKSGLVAIFVSARCKSKKQLNSNTDEDLRVEIDRLRFREIPPEKNIQLFNIPASWNGSRLKGLKKTIIFLSVLNKGEHIISLIPRDSAFIEDIEVKELSEEQSPTFNLEEQAEDGDCRPWYTFVLVDLPLNHLSAEITVERRLWDSDDVKIIINGKVKRNIKGGKYKFWYLIGGILGWIIWRTIGEKKRVKVDFGDELKKNTHYIEFWADRRPVLHKVELDLGKIELKRIPTVDDPNWTGDLRDDPKEILLARVVYGEAGGISKLAKLAVAWSVRNRVEDSRHRWGDNYYEVMLQGKQYDSLWNKETYQKVRVLPLENELEKQAWQDSYEIVEQVIDNRVEDSSKGANHFYSIYIPKPDWADEEKFTFSVDNLRFYKL